MIAAGAAMVALYPRRRRAGGFAAENGRIAANWGLTVLAAMLVIAPAVLALGFAADRRVSFLVVIPLAAYIIVSIAHIAVIFFGMVNTSGGRVFQNPFAIPFLRAEA
jgi:uncharacterized Tic20 family protein